MATILCRCGHRFSDGQIPCPHEATLIADATMFDMFDEIFARLRGGADMQAIHDAAGTLITKYGYPAYTCPECKRLLVLENGYDGPAASYVRE
jgi:hypothetical protein